MDDNSQPTAIRIDDVSKTFKLPHEKTASIKSALINFRKRRTFEKQQVLEDISFEVKKGEFFGIVGRNGSGKSTLLKLIAGIYSPDKGQISIHGKLTPFIELGVGFSPELTGKENVFLNGALLGFNRKEMEARYDEIVEFSELEKFMDQKLKNYSSGMQVRLAFSIAIQAKSDILVLDEVLAVGDIAFQKKCVDYFKQLKKDKQTVILVSHDMFAVEEHCTRALLIHDGSVIDSGDPKEIAAKYRLLNVDSSASKVKTDLQGLFNEVAIDEVTVNGEKESTAGPHQELSVEILYTPKKSRPLIASVSITRTSDGQHVAYYDSRDDSKKIDCQKDHQYRAVCKFNAAQFLGDTYQVDIDFRDKNDVYLAQKLNAVHFSIMSTSPSKAGTFNLQGSWKIQKNSSNYS